MKHYCLNCGMELEDKQYVCPSCHHNVYLDSIDDKMINSAAGILSAANIELNTQWAKYRCGRNGNTGHGFAAEDANNLHDIFSFCKVNSEGRNNAKDGADRIVDGMPIQTKYCATPHASVDAAFANNGQGMYRYISGGYPQLLEVPADQFDACIEIMKDKIRRGQVEGVADPEMAHKIVKKGSCTYVQAKNIAKAGTIDSLIFDAKTGAVVALSSFGISFCVKLAISSTTWKSVDDFKLSVQMAFLDGLKNGTITLSASILTTQILRTEFGRNIIAAATHICKDSVHGVYQYEMGQQLIHDIASGLFSKTLTGGAAKNVVTKLIRVNAITNAVLFIVTSVPDMYSYIIANEISGPQFIKNLVVCGSSLAGATVGTLLGTRLGKIGAVAGGMIGGMAVGQLSKLVADTIHKDDSIHMQELIKIALLELSSEFLIQNEDEFREAMRCISIDKVIDTNLLRAMYAVGVKDTDDVIHVELAKDILRDYFEIVARNRKKVRIFDKEKLILDVIDSISVAV